MGGKNTEIMENMSIVSTTNLLNKMLDFLKTKDAEASVIADELLKNQFDMKTLAKATTLISTSHPATRRFLIAQARYINHLRRKYPKPRLTQKRKTQMLIAYLDVLSAYFSSWDYIEKATLMEGMSKMPTTFVPEEFRQFIEDIQKEK